jgi:hypothetical protein
MKSRVKAGFLVFLRDKKKKNYLQILREFLTLWRVKKEIPLYYFKHLYRKDVKNILEYLGTREAYKVKYSPKLHSPECISIMSNKLSFSVFCNQNELPIPRLVSYNFSSNFFIDGVHHKINSQDELKSYFKSIFENKNLDQLFLKPFSLYGGRGACIISKGTLESDLIKNGKTLLDNCLIHEELLVQHSEINKVNPYCINTLRIETFIDDFGEVNIMSAFMRFGVGESIVDNGHSGGIFVGINMAEGTLKELANEEAHFGNRVYLQHPNTGFHFKNFIVPHFKEACDLVLKATGYLPDRYIGWDIAITEDGPVIIEANERPDLFMSDVAYGGYLKNPKYKEVLEVVC